MSKSPQISLSASTDVPDDLGTDYLLMVGGIAAALAAFIYLLML